MSSTNTQRPTRISQPPQDPRSAVNLDQHRACWKAYRNGRHLRPTLPYMPDEKLILKAAVACLDPKLFSDSAEVKPFSEGQFNALYSISSPLTPKVYLMRLALPVDPFFKTESEVATIQYIKEHTSLPVPNIIAYSSNASNEIGFEWILMDKLNGEPLISVWHGMSLEDKERLVIKLAEGMKSITKERFPLLGSLYFNDVSNQVKNQDSRALGTGIGNDGSFFIGQMASSRFTRDRRLLLCSNRGPFETTQQLKSAEFDVTYQRIQQLSSTPGADYYCTNDTVLAENQAEVLGVFDAFQKHVSSKIATTQGPEDTMVLWHDDLSLNNILVNPTTLDIVGVIDWESVTILPAFETFSFTPSFLGGMDVDEPVRQENEDYSLWLLRLDNWHRTLLRGKFQEVFKQSGGKTFASNSAFKIKNDIYSMLYDFETYWKSVKGWLAKQSSQ